ncbi:MAG: hypothetical protein MRECE_9c036 [Mycoplasmataceae bacterium CE_OT135]|nr:MAG: hypothetical protein MRECE_44c003 [Mycoplasmataceae bacterium CE_OT135]KLL03777.1 MAG: hypothetical protein MRECE_9c036 [Mycoplasmataceae bacterium CE_OT135]
MSQLEIAYRTCHFKSPISVSSRSISKILIDPHYEKHNQEVLESLTRKNIRLSPSELAEKLITDDLICELVKLFHERDFPAWKKENGWEYFSTLIIYHRGKAYHLKWFWPKDAKNNNNFLIVRTCYREDKYDSKE